MFTWFLSNLASVIFQNYAIFKYYNKYDRTVFIEKIVCHFLALMKSFDKHKLCGTVQNCTRINVIFLSIRKKFPEFGKSGVNWAQMSKRSLNLWLKSLNKKIFRSGLLSQLSALWFPDICLVQKLVMPAVSKGSSDESVRRAE